MSAAAARLGESPPTISRKIDELERTLGTQLFVRSTRGVELTIMGKQVLARAETMAEAAELLHREASDGGEVVTGSVTIATGDGLGPYWIAPKLFEFHKLHPRLQVKLMVQDNPPDLHADEADIGIVFAEPHDREIISHRLGTQHYIGFASEAYLKDHGKPESIFEYHKHRSILHTSYVNQVERWAPKMDEMRKMVAFALVTNSGTAIAESCAKGGGIAILPSYMAEIDKRLIPLDLPEIAPIRFWITYTERVRRQPQAKLVIDWLRRIFDSSDAHWFSDEFVHPLQRQQETKVRELFPQVRREK